MKKVKPDTASSWVIHRHGEQMVKVRKDASGHQKPHPLPITPVKEPGDKAWHQYMIKDMKQNYSVEELLKSRNAC
ncbi:hypothetical protein TH61_05375 [Rufibacter sp. DG15C]|nr:hypothetical protein TH61_05375 [Rufibacter sp. DG15C]